MDVLKIATAGSVDDGKSTLIGRLLYDTNSLTDDKLAAIEASSRQKGFDYLDFSLATDGLVAEREQGITIDVAHIYFSTEKRSYIIADTPGHIEYTRNMVTGASTSQAAIILVDARNGVIEQTKRHFYINNLLRVKNIIVAINKMDLMGFSQSIFEDIMLEITKLQSNSEFKDQKITFIPISALLGDNVVDPSTHMDWYTGDSLLHYLEELDSKPSNTLNKSRLPIQTVIRPKTADHHDYRGFAGKLYGGDLEVGDEIMVLPSETKSTIKSIHLFKDSYQKAIAGSSINIQLEDNINVSRGDLITKVNELPHSGQQLKSSVCWMDKKPLVKGAKFLVQIGTNTLLSIITDITIDESNNVINDAVEFNDKLQINQIGQVSLKLNKPVFYDKYSENQSTGSFIMIDPQSNTTAGVGFIE